MIAKALASDLMRYPRLAEICKEASIYHSFTIALQTLLAYRQHIVTRLDKFGVFYCSRRQVTDVRRRLFNENT